MEWFAAASHTSAVSVTVLVLAAVVTVDIIRRFIRDRAERNGHPFPPGPLSLPLLGSALSINAHAPWLTYLEWGKKYGDVIYIRMLDTDVIVLNSLSDVTELLEKRSHIYSDRPFFPTAKPYGHDCNMGLSRYSASWKLCRRIFHKTFSAEASRAFRPMQFFRARQIVLGIMDDPMKYQHHYSMFAGAVAMRTVYDYEPRPTEDPLVSNAHDFLKIAVPALTGRLILLKVFPFLLRVPVWIPGLSWIRRESNHSRALGTTVVEMPYQLVRKRMEAKEDVTTGTMVFDHLQHMEKLDGPHHAEYETALKQAAVAGFLGAVESTTSTLMTFTLAMVKNHRVWKRAQSEIDATIGTDRLPVFGDRPSLPYVDAIMRETFRWQPAFPMGVPHAVTTSDVYKGYYIPSGATIIPNTWAISRDEYRYPDPESFIPERFLNSGSVLNEDNPADYIFGFGRRVCPGRHSADASVWIAMVTMLATLDFNAAKDANGDDIELEANFSSGISRVLLDFPCNLTPRAHITREALEGSLAG